MTPVTHELTDILYAAAGGAYYKQIMMTLYNQFVFKVYKQLLNIEEMAISYN